MYTPSVPPQYYQPRYYGTTGSITTIVTATVTITARKGKIGNINHNYYHCQNCYSIPANLLPNYNHQTTPTSTIIMESVKPLTANTCSKTVATNQYLHKHQSTMEIILINIRVVEWMHLIQIQIITILIRHKIIMRP